MEGAGPREKFIEGGGDLFVAVGIVTSKEDGGVGLTRGGGGSPIEIAGAICSKAEALAPALGGKVGRVLLAFEVEGKEGLDPLGGVLRVSFFRVHVGAADFELFGEDSRVVPVERK